MLKLIQHIEAAIAPTLFFPILAAIRRGTGASKKGLSFGLFLAALISGAYCMTNLGLMLFAAALLIQAILLFVIFVLGYVNQRSMPLIRVPFLLIVIVWTIPSVIHRQIDILAPLIFYLFSDYNLLIPDASDPEIKP